MTTLVAVAIVWRYLYHPRYGLLNHALGIVGIAAHRLVGRSRMGDAGDHPARRLEELRLRHVIFVAGLQSIPEPLYEAARLDGAGWWRQLRDVTLPMLAPTFLFVA